MHGTASAHENPPQGTGAQITAGQIEQRGWSDEDITGAWEAISHIYISLPGKDNAPREIIEEIEQTNELLKEKRLVERFSDDVYNYQDASPGGENVIFDKKADNLYTHHTGDSSVYQFNFKEYQADFLDGKEAGSGWSNFEIVSESKTPILGFEAQKAQLEGAQSAGQAEQEKLIYWVAPELPAWFYELQGQTLPGFPLLRAETSDLDGVEIRIHREVMEIRPIEPEEILLSPSAELRVVPWEAVREDVLSAWGGDFENTTADDDKYRDQELSDELASKEQSLQSEVERTQEEFLKQLEETGPTVYDALSVFQDGLARAERQGQSFYINTQGEQVFEHRLGTVLASERLDTQSDYSGLSSGCYQLHLYDEGVVEHLIVARGNKMGLVDGSNGQWLIEAEYDHLEKRPCQMFKAYKEDQVGLFTFWGQELVPIEFDDVQSFGYKKYFAVQKEGLWGVYDANSQSLAIPIQLQSISYCGGCGLKPEYFYAQDSGQWGILDFNGDKILPFEYEFPAHQNMRSDQWITNLLKADDKQLIHLGTGAHYSYDDYEDIAVLNDFVVLKKDGRFALFNNAGQQITNFELDGFRELDNYLGQKAYIEVIKGDERAVVDDSGALIISWLQAEYIGRLRQDYFLVHYGDSDKLELRDLAGQLLIPAKYDSYGIQTRRDASNEIIDTNVLTVKLDEQLGWYFLDDEVLVEPAFDSIRYWLPEGSEHPYMRVEKDGMDGLYELDGAELLSPRYEMLKFMQPDLLSFRQDGRYGLIDLRTGEELVPPQYAYIESFGAGRLLSLLHHHEQQDTHTSRYQWWDTGQQKMVELPFEDYEPMTDDGLWLVVKDDKSVLYDANAQQTISAPYDAMSDELNGLIIVEKDNYFGVINKEGQEVFPPIYDMALQNDSGFLVLSKQNRHAFWETIYTRPDGELIFPEPMVTWQSPDFYDAPLIRADEQEIFVSAYDPKRRDDYLGVFSWDGTERLASQYEVLVLYDDGPGYGAITKGKVGLYDGQGNEVFPAILDDVYYADMSMPWAVIREQKTEFPLLSRIKRKYFYIDENGDVLPVMADTIIEFDERNY